MGVENPLCPRRRQALVVTTAANAAAGEELCLSYGPLQNWELLMYYGFCDADGGNAHDRLTVLPRRKWGPPTPTPTVRSGRSEDAGQA